MSAFITSELLTDRKQQAQSSWVQHEYNIKFNIRESGTSCTKQPCSFTFKSTLKFSHNMKHVLPNINTHIYFQLQLHISYF
jgi:hypothetical protein